MKSQCPEKMVENEKKSTCGVVDVKMTDKISAPPKNTQLQKRPSLIPIRSSKIGAANVSENIKNKTSSLAPSKPGQNAVKEPNGNNLASAPPDKKVISKAPPKPGKNATKKPDGNNLDKENAPTMNSKKTEKKA